ncbi:hypothetical protein B0H17DRAFT_943975, partial [Mycena rosella]
VGEPYPCGFCGHSGRAECAVPMKPKGEIFEIKSNCKYSLTFQYKKSNEGSGTTPSLPIICSLCPKPDVPRYPTYPGIWRYNMPQHLRDFHPKASPLQPEGDPLPFKLWQNVRVDKAEEMALGIPEFLIPHLSDLRHHYV